MLRNVRRCLLPLNLALILPLNLRYDVYNIIEHYFGWAGGWIRDVQFGVFLEIGQCLY